VLILPPGHGKAVATMRPLNLRERWILRGVGGLVAVLVVVVVLAVVSAGHSTGGGCIDVTVPYSIGGQEFYKCGAAARSMCGQVGQPGGFSGRAGDAVATECRKAGLSVGR
jgi:hypothetical protein